MSLYIPEFVGTLILVLLSNGVVANVILDGNRGQESGWLVISMGWGMAMFVALYVTSWVGGTHINPAVTVAMALVGRCNWSLVPAYLLAQGLGAMAGSGLVYLAHKKQFDHTHDAAAILSSFSSSPVIRSHVWNLVTEIIATAVFLFGFLVLTDSSNGSLRFALAEGGTIATGQLRVLTSLAAGLLVGAISLSLGGPTSAVINPARDLGPRIMHAILPIPNKSDSDWSYAWVPVLGPFLGGMLGALLHKIVFV